MSQQPALTDAEAERAMITARVNHQEATYGVRNGGLPLPPGYGTVSSAGSSGLPPPPSGAGAPPSTSAKHSA